MACLDIQDVYLHVRMHPSTRKFLCFQANGQHFEFTCHPFGLNIPPLVFTSILRGEHINVLAYLDDLIVWDTSTLAYRRVFLRTASVLQEHGFLIRRDVSASPEPTQGLAGLPMELSLPVSFALSIEPEQCIAMFTDSISAFYACLKQGSLKAPLIHKIYGDIFEVLQRRHLTLLPRYILRIRNVLADALPLLDPVSTE